MQVYVFVSTLVYVCFLMEASLIYHEKTKLAELSAGFSIFIKMMKAVLCFCDTNSACFIHMMSQCIEKRDLHQVYVTLILLLILFSPCSATVVYQFQNGEASAVT